MHEIDAVEPADTTTIRSYPNITLAIFQEGAATIAAQAVLCGIMPEVSSIIFAYTIGGSF